MDVVVAAFDVDNTLTVRDCVVPFMRKVAGTRGFLLACVAQPLRLTQMVVRKDRDGIKAHFVERVFSGKSIEQVEEAGVQFAVTISRSWIREDVAQRLRWHQEQGHVVVLVSASLEPYLVPFGDLCEVDAVLCTQLEEKDGVYTGKILGSNCRGQEKVTRLRDWMQNAGISAEALIFAYGDSSGDTALLAAAEHGVMVKKVEISREYV